MDDERKPLPEQDDSTVEPRPEKEENEGDILDIDEPSAAVRLSPYAIAAFVVSIVGLWAASQSFLFSQPFLYPPFTSFGWSQIVFELLPPLLVPIGVAVVALLLAGRAQLEILDAAGRLGGVGFYRAARVAGTAVLVLVVLAVVMRLIAPAFAEAFSDGVEQGGEGLTVPDPPRLPSP